MSDLRKWKALVENVSKLTEDPVQDADYTDHEVSMAKSQMLSSMKSINRIAKHLATKSESEGLEGWTASKLTMAEDYLQVVADYFDGQEINESQLATVGGKIPTRNPRGNKIGGVHFSPEQEEIIKKMFKKKDKTDEGYKVLPPMDKEKYQARDGLEGPFSTLSGKVVYYDPKAGKYYDPDTDMYMSYDEFRRYDDDYKGMKDERDEVKEETVMVSEEQFDEAAGEKDACYHKVKSRYKVWPSAYASGALVKCRKVGAKNWGNSKKD